jgi:hypothetical protein
MGDIKVQRIFLQCIDVKRFAAKIAKKSINAHLKILHSINNTAGNREKREFRFVFEHDSA